MMVMMIKEYKKKLGKKLESYSFPSGKETFAIRVFENGFVLKKRKNIIVLDRLSLWNLKDIVERFEKKKGILENLE
jgi:hypothetical protein